MIHRLAEIVEQDTSTTHLTLRILLHTLQFLVVDVLLSTLLRKLSERDDVADLIEEHRLTRQTVTSATTNLLIIALNALRQIIVHHEAHITLVDAHTKSNGGTHHIYFVVDESLLHPITSRRRQSGMISHRPHSLLLQLGSHTLRGLTTHTIYDAALARMTSYECHDEALLILGGISPANVQREIRTIKGRHEDRSLSPIVLRQSKLLHDVLLRYLVRCSSKRSHRHTREKLLQLAQLRIFRTEVMSPLRDAMSLVHSEHAHLQLSRRRRARRVM